MPNAAIEKRPEGWARRGDGWARRADGWARRADGWARRPDGWARREGWARRPDVWARARAGMNRLFIFLVKGRPVHLPPADPNTRGPGRSPRRCVVRIRKIGVSRNTDA